MTERTARRGSPSYYLTSDGRVVFGKKRSKLRIALAVLAVLLVLGSVVGAATLVGVVWKSERTPREWAVALRQQTFGGNRVLTHMADAVANWLARNDTLGPAADLTVPALIGAGPEWSGASPRGAVLTVSTVAALRDAVGGAVPGDVIVLAPGRYRIEGSAIQAATIGNPNGTITLRAEKLGDAVIESAVTEAFNVTGAFWRFENLVMRGVCSDPSDCEHAIHVAGAATDVVIRNNRIEDFNAHLKVNGDRGDWPDRGVIEGNTLIDTVPRQTRNPIALIDVVGASDWRTSENFIADFARAGSGGPTYGAYYKGAGHRNVFERNVVLCAWKLPGPPGPRVGLSLGGGSTSPELRRDSGAIGMEQVGGVIRDNLIAFCSDAGIYLNRAARSAVTHNTLLDTVGIEARFIETSGDVIGNIVDGVVRIHDGAGMTAWENDAPFLPGMFLGRHPQRAYYQNPARLDLRWAAAPGYLPPDPNDIGTDLCGRDRTLMTRAGAFDDFVPCLGRDRPSKRPEQTFIR